MMRYKLTSPGAIPVELEYARDYLKNPPVQDNQQVSTMLAAVTQYAEGFTGREFRVNAWTYFFDYFETRLLLRRSPVASIVSVNRFVSESETAVDSANYYLKKGVRWSEVLLKDGSAWPTDQDLDEHSVNVKFLTEPTPHAELWQLGMLKHLAFCYENRGDTTIPFDSNSQRTVALLGYEGALASGALAIYQQFRIPRI